MRKMILVLAAFLAAAAVSMQALADDDGPPPPGGPDGPGPISCEDRAAMLKYKLSLTDEQYSSVLSIMQGYDEKRKELERGDREAIDGLMKSEQEDISAVLNETQAREFSIMLNNRRKGKRPPKED